MSLGALESEIRARLPEQVDFFVEYLESQRLEDPTYEKSEAEALQEAYVGKKFDVVIVANYPALVFAVNHRATIFPGVPIIFEEVYRGRIDGQKMWPGVTGVTNAVDVQSTVDLALSLHPKTNAVAVITDTSQFEKYWLGIVHAELLHHRDLKEIDLVGSPSEELLQQVELLPPRTVILFQVLTRESVQSAVGALDILAAASQHLPTYCIFPLICMNHGGIGGAEFDINEQTMLTAQMVVRVLKGERPENIPVIHGTKSQVQVDWRQLQRWNVPESKLPHGALILYRDATFWERDQKYIIAAVILIFLQFVLIIGLLWQRRQKRKAEVILRESEQRFRVMADAAPALIWMCDQAGRMTYLNERRVMFTGPDPNAGLGDTWKAYVHPDDLRGVMQVLIRALKTGESFSKEYRLRRFDGAYRWMFDVASPRTNGDGSFAGFIGSAIDVTDQKLAQEALEKVSGRLIEAQEKERTRIARDLHDDICQRLALLSVELEQANRNVNGSPLATKQRLEEIRSHCSGIAGDVQLLSHQLHSSKLEYLGIAAAVRGFCREFSEQNEVVVNFIDKNVPARLPTDVSLCLFRIAQEALHNAVKYSEADEFDVELSYAANQVQLVVEDSGIGFDVEKAKKQNGLGLVSMQERAHLVHGRLEIDSCPGDGTRVIAIVPNIAAFSASARGDASGGFGSVA